MQFLLKSVFENCTEFVLRKDLEKTLFKNFCFIFVFQSERKKCVVCLFLHF